MREPRRDLFGQPLPVRLDERVVDFMYTLPEWLQPWFALLCFVVIGAIFIFGIYVLMYGATALR